MITCVLVVLNAFRIRYSKQETSYNFCSAATRVLNARINLLRFACQLWHTAVVEVCAHVCAYAHQKQQQHFPANLACSEPVV